MPSERQRETMIGKYSQVCTGMLRTKQTLDLLSFNVEGLDSMLEDPSFTSLVDSHDICFLTKTMRKEDTKLNIDGFWDFSQIRPKTKKKGRFSGGITVLAELDIRPGIKIVDSSEGFVWIKLDKVFFNFINDLYICAVYIPPKNSSKEINLKTDYFHSLLEFINKYIELGNVVLAGDLNSRIGNENVDENLNILFIDESLPDECRSPVVIPRSSCHSTTNQYGRTLTQICQRFNLIVANSRTPGDMLGNLTSKGSSVVDLVIADHCFLKNINRLKVLPPEYSSVHSPISINVKCDFNITERKIAGVKPAPPKIIWDDNKSEIMKNRLKSGTNKKILAAITLRLKDKGSSPGELNAFLNKFNETLVQEATSCMKLASRKKTKKKQKGKKWYDGECHSMKRRLQNLARLLVKKTKIPLLGDSIVR